MNFQRFFPETFLHASLQANFSKALTSDFSMSIFKCILQKERAGTEYKKAK